LNEDPQISKSQLDKLGSRLRNSADPDDEDLVLLDRYRQRFVLINDTIVAKLRDLADFAVESRHKSVPSIVAKLRRRQPARLSAIQDLAGARIIVPGLHAQDDFVQKLLGLYPESAVDDKRGRPTFNYRAIHVVVSAPLPYEVQIRTELQHVWAELSERLADRYGFELKYGGGPPNITRALAEYSDFAFAVDRFADPRVGGAQDVTGVVEAYLERLPAIMETLKTR
jgi:ppGpp synthetase/RelA/SpoT-type nucleotidyltranferase